MEQALPRILYGAGSNGMSSAVPRIWRAAPNRQPDGSAEARARAAQLLLRARGQARTMLAETEESAVAIRQTAQQEGWQQGYAAGLEQARREQAPIAQRLATLVSGATIEQETSARNLDEAVLALVLACTRALVHHEVSIAPETILDTVRESLKELCVESAVILHVHPEDAALVQSQVALLGIPSAVHLTVLSNPNISAGGCLIESGAGRVDATIEKQQERLASLLHDHIRS